MPLPATTVGPDGYRCWQRPAFQVEAVPTRQAVMLTVSGSRLTTGEAFQLAAILTSAANAAGYQGSER